MNRQDEDGFTLIELLVVIIIIGILASIAIPTFLGQRDRSYRSAMITDLRNIAVDAETYWADNLGYSGFSGDVLFTSNEFSTGVNIVVAQETATGFCLHATHANMPEVWYYDSDGAPAINDSSC